MKMTNVSGAVVWSATYDAFGKATVDAGASITNNLRFPGQYYDNETGMHYNGARVYMPDTGRYATRELLLEINPLFSQNPLIPKEIIPLLSASGLPFMQYDLNLLQGEVLSIQNLSILLHPYTYARSSPLLYMDPSGFKWWRLTDWTCEDWCSLSCHAWTLWSCHKGCHWSLWFGPVHYGFCTVACHIMNDDSCMFNCKKLCPCKKE